ncbi:secreted RxLR effector peptide protein, putative [Phytophthora infestans T30-4]|uniref:Secreted RxLR effector peptide protein, putative n=1 Tax=Phytophthora infestans (strain T30-4) TaxID=403677 RepID=D0NQF1_PHYIT|nr:secreted RxLR effector peptide protein, putative [Phytophthora infestans T30-4]EEY62883.1 secreted RxLR effector peptide protein, putative [Phytophthora infestans T30-4]|eukprot:XP_002898758.1 secreted RxLR effector peptide protein, putative [Phytophthora infestans T30-4]
MRSTLTVVVLVVTFLEIYMVFADAEDTALTNRADTKSDTKLTDFVRNLRGQNVKDEERTVPNYAAMSNLLHSTPSGQSAQILYAVENHKPLPKREKALLVVLGLGMVSGGIFGSIKLTQAITRNLDKMRTEREH